MIRKNYVEVPSSKDMDLNTSESTWKGGKCISIDEGKYITVFVDHQNESIIRDTNGVKQEQTITRALPIRVEKPMSRDKLINAAEMEAYNLHTAMDVASYNASLARKSRENETDGEIKEHDDFINFIKDCLTNIGIL
jgi:hypothetical protein